MINAASALALAALTVWLPGGSNPRGEHWPRFAPAPRAPGDRRDWSAVAGRSALGRRIEIHHDGQAKVDEKVLVFGCIHGDECAASDVRPTTGCPPYGMDVYTVPNLNPDGYLLGTRLNGRGVDLNRNFPSGWRPIGGRGTAQYSGPQPFSEPETRLAAKIIRRLRPEVTIWFHQHFSPRPLVRAWGASTRLARRYAELANLPFRAIKWQAGTAPNWQNHAFPGTTSFVVELPQTAAKHIDWRLGLAIAQLAREVAAR
jgi:protein MpaA